MKKPSSIIFTVRMEKRLTRALDKLRPDFGNAPRASLIRIACEKLIHEHVAGRTECESGEKLLA